MNELRRAWSVMGLDGSSSREAIELRHKRLAEAWRPDRFSSEEGRLDAEKELEKINAARDVLMAHIDSGGHLEKGCSCEEGMSMEESSSSEEELARRRDEERRRRGSEAGTTRGPGAGGSAEPAQTSSGVLALAGTQERDQELRWIVAGVEVAVFIALTTLGMTGYSMKVSWGEEHFRRGLEESARDGTFVPSNSAAPQAPDSQLIPGNISPPPGPAGR